MNPRQDLLLRLWLKPPSSHLNKESQLATPFPKLPGIYSFLNGEEGPSTQFATSFNDAQVINDKENSTQITIKPLFDETGSGVIDRSHLNQ